VSNDSGVAVTDSREVSPNESAETAEVTTKPTSEFVKPKNPLLMVERRDSDSSIASTSTIDSEGPVTPDEEVSCLRLGDGKGMGDSPSLELLAEEGVVHHIPVQGAAIMV